MQTINRESLLNELEAVSPGLSPKGELDQCDCFVFEEGKVRTFNDEIYCEAETTLQIKGAVQAVPLIDLLRKIKHENISIGVDKQRLIIQTKGQTATIAMSVKVALAYNTVDDPRKWRPLPADFLDGLKLVAECASDDKSSNALSCVRFTNEFMEAADSWHVGRFNIELPIKRDMFIRKEAAKHIVDLALETISIGSQWAHFQSADGSRLSCRVSRAEDFPDISGILDVEGEPITFPKMIGESIDRAEVFIDAEESKDRLVTVALKPGRMQIRGEGDSGTFVENKKLDYKGSPTKFMMPPDLLRKISEKYSRAKLADDRLGVKVESFRYVTSLYVD